MNQQVPCPACGKGRLYVPPPQIHLDNLPTVSVVAIAREKFRCDKCDACFGFTFLPVTPETAQFQIQVALMLAPVAAPADDGQIKLVQSMPKSLLTPQ